jgi:hypothetical protein
MAKSPARFIVAVAFATAVAAGLVACSTKTGGHCQGCPIYSETAPNNCKSGLVCKYTTNTAGIRYMPGYTCMYPEEKSCD